MAATPGSRIAVIPAGQDLLNEQRKVGGNTIEFKLIPDESHDLFIGEITCYERGGPARHLHHDRTSSSTLLKASSLSR
jgi:hypothetical protein